MYHFQIFTEVDPVKWNNDLLKSDHSTFFQTTEYLNSTPDRFYPIFIYVFDENNNVVGQLGLHIIKTAALYASPFLLKILKIIQNISKRGIWVDGPIFHTSDPKERKQILETFIKSIDVVLDQHNLVFIYGYSPSRDFQINKEYKQEFENNGYTLTEFVTYIADMSKNIDEIWNNVHHNARRDITRAKKRNIIVKELETFDELRDYLLLHEKWAKTKGLSVTYSSEEVNYLWNNHTQGLEKFFLAYSETKLISALRVSCFNNIAYANFILSSYEGHTSLGGPMLTWYALEWAKKTGMKFYDFSGGLKPQNNPKQENSDSALVYYKKKWGGEEITYYKFLKIRKALTYSTYKILNYLLVLNRNLKKKNRPKKNLE